MQIGLAGLGQMGNGMVRRLLGAGHACVVYDTQPSAAFRLVKLGAMGVRSLKDLVGRLSQPRVLRLIVPASGVDLLLSELAPLLEANDIVVDGGNSNYRDDIRRATELHAADIQHLDVGTSGGIAGLDRGYFLMMDGENILRNANVGRAKPARDAETTPLRNPEFYQFEMKLPEIAEVWRRGSVIGSWLLGMTAQALLKDLELGRYAGRVSDSGEGCWTLQAAIEEGVPVPVLSAALFERFSSRGGSHFTNRILSAMREEFGGHAEKDAV